MVSAGFTHTCSVNNDYHLLCIHTHTHTHIRTYTRTYTHRYAHMHTHTFTHEPAWCLRASRTHVASTTTTISLHTYIHAYTYIHIHIHSKQHGVCGLHAHMQRQQRLPSPLLGGPRQQQDQGTYIHTHMNAYIHACMCFVCIHVHLSNSSAGGMLTRSRHWSACYMHTYIHTYIHTYMHAYDNDKTMVCVLHACMHTYIHTYIHRYI